MEELDNLSIKSFSTLNSIDSESTDNKLNQNESIDKELNNRESINNQLIDEELNNKELMDKKLDNKESTDKSINEELNDDRINLNDNQINLNDNQQSKTKSIDLNFVNDDSNKSADLNEKIKSIDNLLSKDKWILKLNWNFRVELIKLLDEYVRLLVSDEEILIDEKELIEKNKNDLIKLLTKTPLKLDEESNSYKIFINLDNNFKHEIIDQLIKNENLIIDYRDEIDSNLKDKLIEENNCIINKIINLPVEYSNNDVNLVDDEELESSQSESLDEKFVNELETVISNLKNETIDLKEEMNKLKSKSDDGNSIKLYLVKKDMKKFFENDSDFYSEGITHFNIKWYIYVRSRYDDDNDDEKKKYLGFYLHAKNDIDDKNGVKWKCTTTYEFILKNNLPDKQDKVKKLGYTFDKSTGYGFPKFISEDELFNLDNGHMQDDTIKLELNLKVDKIERNI